MRGQQLALARPKPFWCCRSDLQDHLGIVSAFRRNARGQYNTVDVHSEYYHEQIVLSRALMPGDRPNWIRRVWTCVARVISAAGQRYN
jgi:hypothetical protein